MRKKKHCIEGQPVYSYLVQKRYDSSGIHYVKSLYARHFKANELTIYIKT